MRQTCLKSTQPCPECISADGSATFGMMVPLAIDLRVTPPSAKQARPAAWYRENRVWSRWEWCVKMDKQQQ